MGVGSRLTRRPSIGGMDQPPPPPTLLDAWTRVLVSARSRWPSSEAALLAAKYLHARLTHDTEQAQSLFDVVGDAELAEGMTRVACALVVHLSVLDDAGVSDVLDDLVAAAHAAHQGLPGAARDA